MMHVAIMKSRLRGFLMANRFGRQLYSLANRVRLRLARRVSDADYARKIFHENTGGRLDLENPRTLAEKTWWLKLNNRDPLLRVCTDKVQVRQYVQARGLGHLLNEIYGVFDSVDDVDFDALPDSAYLKLNNSSGTNALWRRGSSFDHAAFRSRFGRAMKRDYYWQSREWNYRGIEPRIIAERVIEEADLVDWRFVCFGGQVRLIFVDVDTAAPDGTHAPDALRNIYTREFELLPVEVGRENFPQERVQRPARFEEMVAAAETLAAPFEFCRVDLYAAEERIIFGEITFYPGGGMQLVSPSHYDDEWGSWIDLGASTIIRNPADACGRSIEDWRV